MNLAPTYYPHLPKNKIELLDGRVYLGGSLAVSRMVLSYILQGYGAGYMADLIGRELLREALIEAFGDGKPWQPPQFEEVFPATPVHRMASELMMGIYTLRCYVSMGRDMVVRLGEDALTPDVFVYAPSTEVFHREYFYETTPDLIIEVMHPATRAFDAALRRARYQAAGVGELWFIDYEKAELQVYRQAADYQPLTWDQAPLASTTVPGLTLHPPKLWAVKEQPMRNAWDLITGPPDAPEARPEKHRRQPDEPRWGSLPFAPEIGLEPTPVSFEQFIAWAPEAKFEWIDGKPLIGGGDHTTLHLAGLLMMTLGLTETVKLLEPKAWQALH